MALSKRSRRANWMLFAGVAAILVTIASFALSLSRLQARARALQDVELRYEQAAQQLMATVGFVGLIHNFKNCVLRGATEPGFCTATEAQAEQARQLLQTLERLAADGKVIMPAAPIHEMIEAYGNRVARVRAGHAAGEAISAIDAAVRWNDAPSAEALGQILRATSAQLSMRVARLNRDTAAQYGFAILLLVALGGWLAAVIYREARLSRRREQQLSAVFAAVAGGLVAFDGAGRVVLANAAAREMLRLPEGPAPLDWPLHARLDWAGAPPAPGQAGAEVAAPLARAICGDTLHEALCTLRLSAPATGPERLLRLSTVPLDLPDFSLRSVLSFEDVSEQERQRGQIERISRLDALGQLTGGIAHDFNNHLATLTYAIDLALNERPTPPARRVLTSAARSIEQGRALTDRLLTFASRAPGTPQAERAEAVLHALRPFAEAALPPGIALSLTVEPPDLAVECDLAQLENVLLNLVINARDAILSAGPEGHIRVSARPAAPQPPALAPPPAPPLGQTAAPKLEIRVTDDGPGMSPEVRRQATDPFFTTKPGGAGTGLGLAMAYGFARQSCGSLTIRSEEGAGTTIRLTLPRAEACPAQPAAPHRHAAAPLPPGAGETLLLAEADPELRGTMAALLHGMGYRVEPAATASQAQAILARNAAVKLALCDVTLRGSVAGLSLTAELAQSHPALPVLPMSGNAAPPAHGPASPGQPPILHKPCAPEALSAALREALQPAAFSRSPASAAASPYAAHPG